MQKGRMNTNDIILFIVSWALGGASGALRAWRIGEDVPLRHIIASGLMSGMISLMCVAYLYDNGITTPMAVAISIGAGITADDIIRILYAYVQRVIGDGGKR